MSRQKKRRGRGEGSLVELADGRWRAFASAGVAGGKRRRLSKVFKTKKEALDWQREKASQIATGSLPTAGGMTLLEWLDKWASIKRGKVEPGTLWFYEDQIKRNLTPACGGYLLAQLRPLDVETILADMHRNGRSPDGVNKAARTLKSALKDAVEKGLIRSSPADKLAPVKFEPVPVQPLDLDQAKAFLAVAAFHRLAALWELALDSGMRQGELLALHWPEVNTARRSIRVIRSLEQIDFAFRLKPPKSKKSKRTVVIAERTCVALDHHRDRMKLAGRDVSRGPVFLSRVGQWIGKGSLAQQLRSLLAQAGVPYLRFHGLRHTNATLLLRAGVNIKIISERLGHENVATTLRLYAHVLDSDQGQAAEAIERLFGDFPLGTSSGAD